MHYVTRAAAALLAVGLYPAGQARAAILDQDVRCPPAAFCDPFAAFDPGLGKLTTVSFVGEVGFFLSYLVVSTSPDPVTATIRSDVDLTLSFQGGGAPWMLATSASAQKVFNLQFYGVDRSAFGGSAPISASTTDVAGFIGPTPITITAGGDLRTTLSGSGFYLDPDFSRGDGPSVFGVLSYVYEPLTSAVPEPGMWALTIAGFGTIGGCARRRRRIAIRPGATTE